MAMEIVVAVAAKIGEYLVAPIGRQLGYFIHYNRNIENLRNQVQKLGDMRHGVQGSVDAANRNGEEIKADVENWLTSVNAITSEVETFLEDDHVKFNKRCFSGRCPDWSSRYCLSKKAKKKSLKLIELEEESTKFGSVSFPAPPPPPGIESIPIGDFVDFESTESAKKEIMEALKDAEINIIGLYGMGGVGKTTLVKKVGKQAKEDKLFDEVVLAVVSQPPNYTNIQGQIAEKLGLKFDESETEDGRADRLRARLKKEKRILVILDDVWEKLSLEAVGIPFGDDHEGCKIVLTTRHQKVCHKMGIQTKAIRLNVLSQDDSWNLFRKNAGQAVDSPTLNVVAREVAKHCGGLPIALVTVGRALRNEDLNEWEKAALKLKDFKPTDNEDIDQEVFSCLKLSYDYVKGEETKSCFLLCCLFPEDHNIPIEELARYGMGQGLFRNVETMEEARCKAHTAVKNLKASCLLLDSYTEEFVKMHDVVRHAAILIASKDKDMWVRSGIGLKEWPNKQTFKDDTVISLMYNEIKELPDGLECPKLETLLLQGNDKIPFVPEDFGKGMEALKVLDISGAPRHEYDLRTFRSLTNLRTLHLKYLLSLTNLRTLHLKYLLFMDISILGELKKLEILSLKESSFKELPKEIGQLTKLRLLDLSFCEIEIIQPNVLSSLSKLEELHMLGGFQNWEVERTNKRSNASPAELKSLGCLTILSMTIPNANCLPNDLRLPKLIKFHIAIGNILNLENCPSSNTMYLEDIETPSGDSIKGLLEITETLYLRRVKGLRNILPDLCREGLNVLKSLNVTNCSEIQYLTNAIEGSPHMAFWSLEKLHVFRLDSLRQLCHDQSFENLSDSLEGIVSKQEEKVEHQDSSRNLVLTFPNLKILKIYECKSLKSLLSLTLAQGLPQLEEIKITFCNNLEEIVAKDFRAFNKGFACFENLKSLHVVGCYKLRSLFSHSMTRCLLQLEELYIYFCDIMEEVVSKEKEGEEAVDKIVFPQLKTLELLSLYKLRSFCLGNFSFEWPSLEQVLVYCCPKMETFTAAALGIQSTPKLKEIELNGEKIHLMGDLNTVIQNWFKGKGKVDEDDEFASESEIQEVDEDDEFASESEIQEVDEDDEFASESEIQEICEYDEFTRDFLSGMESTSKFQEVDKGHESTSKIQEVDKDDESASKSEIPEASSSSTGMNQRPYRKFKRWPKEGLSLRHSSGHTQWAGTSLPLFQEGPHSKRFTAPKNRRKKNSLVMVRTIECWVRLP